MFKAFIFDMDGVIIDSEPLHFRVDEQVITSFGVAVTKEQLEEFVGMTNPAMWALLKERYSMTPTIEEMIAIQLEMKLAYLLHSDEHPIAGIRELIEDLHSKGMKIGLASSSPRSFIEAVLSKFNLTSYFDCMISGEEVEHGKPAPDIYIKAAELLETDARECIVLEDSKHGLTAAHAAGMTCIGFRNLNSGNQDLSQADHIVNAISEIDDSLLNRL
ncbi:HAD family hydrolase [Paenibacillus lutrae]|uniref:HAD-IA family hydrolase n=1 Tax=Paenibacillus lutrae TaxID=2078573 RepID=A0A7X3FH49_9BACL|nr:HAD family phosphatase [Paenibacillus lutrae]MVO99532.1 HAD-IA family hydrolase [Paenibacillus lutrae]